MTAVSVTATRKVDGVAVTATAQTTLLRPKKGVGASKYLLDIGKLQVLNVSWTYNWSCTTTPDNEGGLDYVPMFWGKSAVTAAHIADMQAGKASGKFDTLLAFNEPDHPQQSNITVDATIALWPQIQSTGLRLGSPAVTSPNGMNNTSTPGVSWLDDFMTKCNAKGYKVDFIALHYYVDWTDVDAVSKLQTSLTAVWNKWHKPIWITEIGTIDIFNAWGGHMDLPADFVMNTKYMKGVIPMLNALPFVERYSWFSDNKWDATSPTSPRNYTSLYDASDVLTPLGVAYKDL